MSRRGRDPEAIDGEILEPDDPMPKHEIKRGPGGRYAKGQSGNPNGISAHLQKMHRSNARKASYIRGRMLDSVIMAMEEMDKPLQIWSMMEANLLTLLRDAENRALGTPRQSVEMKTNNRSITADITASMDPEEAARLYQASLGSGDDT